MAFFQDNPGEPVLENRICLTGHKAHSNKYIALLIYHCGNEISVIRQHWAAQLANTHGTYAWTLCISCTSMFGEIDLNKKKISQSFKKQINKNSGKI